MMLIIIKSENCSYTGDLPHHQKHGKWVVSPGAQTGRANKKLRAVNKFQMFIIRTKLHLHKKRKNMGIFIFRDLQIFVSYN